MDNLEESSISYDLIGQGPANFIKINIRGDIEYIYNTKIKNNNRYNINFKKNNNKGDIFKQIQNCSKKNNNRHKIQVIVAGNAGLPGGKHGTCLADTVSKLPNLKNKPINYIINYVKQNPLIIIKNHKLRQPNIPLKKKIPVEEAIMEKMFKIPLYNKYDIDRANQFFAEKIGLKWGFIKSSTYIKSYNPLRIIRSYNPFTIQGIDYTIPMPNNPDIKYNKCFKVQNIKIDNVNVNLLFTFAPNYNHKFPSGKATLEPINTPYFKKEALKWCIRSCINKCTNGYLIIPHLGAGVNKCFLVNKYKNKQKNREMNKFEFIKLVHEVVHEPRIYKNFKFLVIYILFFRK